MPDFSDLAQWLQRVVDSPDRLVFWVFVIALVAAATSFAARWVLGAIATRLQKTDNFWDDSLCAALKWPVPALIWIVALSMAAKLIHSQTGALIFAAVDPIRDVAVIVVFTWFAASFVGHVEQFYKRRDATQLRLDYTSIEAIARVVRIALVVTAILMTLQKLGYDITGILAMGSIGGIAISFAAKDMIANFFGGMMVYLDRPFSVGDWIRSPDREIEGTVEHIGWRTTRVRTFDSRPLYVPNAYFTTISVENPSRMLNRRIFETIGVRHEDLAVLPAIVDEILAMLKQHDGIDSARTLMVNFDTFGGSSLDFFIYAFTRTRVWAEYHVVKQDVLLQVGEIVTRHGAVIAVPARTLRWPEQRVLANASGQHEADDDGGRQPDTARAAAGRGEAG